MAFTFEELKRLAGLQRNMTNDEFAKQIANVNRRLLALNFEFQNEEHDIIQFALFAGFVTSPTKRTLTVSVNSRFSFLLNDLTSQFTRFELAEFTALRSSYAKECYRRLKQYRQTGVWKVDKRNREPCKPPHHSQPTPSRKASRPTPSASSTGQERSSRIGGSSRSGQGGQQTAQTGATAGAGTRAGTRMEPVGPGRPHEPRHGRQPRLRPRPLDVKDPGPCRAPIAREAPGSSASLVEKRHLVLVDLISGFFLGLGGTLLTGTVCAFFHRGQRKVEMLGGLSP